MKKVINYKREWEKYNKRWNLICYDNMQKLTRLVTANLGLYVNKMKAEPKQQK
jgi:hypothetical protein